MKNWFKLIIIFLIFSPILNSLLANDYFKEQKISYGDVYRELSSYKDQKIWKLLDIIGYDFSYFRFHYRPEVTPHLILYYHHNDSLFIQVNIKTKDYENYTHGFDDINVIKDEDIVDVYYYLEKIDIQMHERLKEGNYCDRQELESRFYPYIDNYVPSLGNYRKLRSVKKFEARYVKLLKDFEGMTFSQILDKIGNDDYGYFVYPKRGFEKDSGYFNAIDLRYPYKDSLEISVVFDFKKSFKYNYPNDIKNALKLKVTKIRNYLLPLNKLDDFIRIEKKKD